MGARKSHGLVGSSVGATSVAESYSNEISHRCPTKSTLWLFNIAMEHAPFIDGLPIKNGDFPWLC